MAHMQSIITKHKKPQKWVHGTWANLAEITIGINIIFEETLAFRRERNIVSSNRVTVQTEM